MGLVLGLDNAVRLDMFSPQRYLMELAGRRDGFTRIPAEAVTLFAPLGSSHICLLQTAPRDLARFIGERKLRVCECFFTFPAMVKIILSNTDHSSPGLGLSWAIVPDGTRLSLLVDRSTMHCSRRSAKLGPWRPPGWDLIMPTQRLDFSSSPFWEDRPASCSTVQVYLISLLHEPIFLGGEML